MAWRIIIIMCLLQVLSAVTGLITDHLDVLTCSELLLATQLCHGILHKLIPSITLPPVHQDNQAITLRPESRSSVVTHSSMNYRVNYSLSNQVVPNYPAAMMEEMSSSLSSVGDGGQGIVQIGIEASEVQSQSDASSNILGEDLADLLPHDATDEEAGFSAPASLCNSHEPSLSNGLRHSSSENNVSNSPSHISASTVNPASSCNDVSNHVDASDYEDEHSSNFGNDLNREKNDDSENLGNTNEDALCSLYKYVLEFEKFFCNLVQQRIIPDPEMLEEFQRVLLSSGRTDTSSSKVGDLHSLLQECLVCALQQEHEKSEDTRAAEAVSVRSRKSSLNVTNSQLAAAEASNKSSPTSHRLVDSVELR